MPDASPVLRGTPTSVGIVGLVTALAMLVFGLPAHAANPEQERVAQMRAQLQSVRDELGAASDDADGAQIALADADRQLEAVFSAVDSARQAVDRQGESVTDAEERLSTAAQELTVQQELLAERISRLYVQARPDDVVGVLGARTVTEAVQQSTYMHAIGRDDRAQVETLSNAQRTVEAEEQALHGEQTAMAQVLLEQEALLAEVEEIRDDRALVAAASGDLVARLQAREDHLEEESAELGRLARERAAQEAAAARAVAVRAQERAAATPRQSATLQGRINQPTAEQGSVEAPDAATAPVDALAESPGQTETAAAVEAPDTAEAPAEPVEPPTPVASSGGFSWPTQGTVTSEFGSRWGRNHDGLDIANSIGTPVSAARGGSVISVTSGSGYGNLVVVGHGGGLETYYAHLSSVNVSVGQSVSTGSSIGAMGCSGSCTGPHLHFEIRSAGAPGDPRAYL